MSLLQNAESNGPRESFFQRQTLLLLSISRLVERIAYVLITIAVAFSYMQAKQDVTEEELLEIFEFVLLASMLLQPLGGIIGDKLLGSKNAVLIGGLLEFAGIVVLSYPSQYTMYFGLGVLIIGEALFSPNILARFGRNFYKMPRKMDSGFVMISLAVVIPSIFSFRLIELIRDHLVITFVFLSIAVILSLVINYFVKDQEISEDQVDNKIFKPSGIKLGATLAVASLFYAIYYFTIDNLGDKLSEIHEDIINSTGVSESLLFNFEPFLLILLMVSAGFLWHNKKVDSLNNLYTGLLLGALASLTLMLGLMNESSGSYYFLFIIVVSFAQVLVGPSFLSALTQFANPKFLGLFMGLFWLIMKLLWLIPVAFNVSVLSEPGISLGSFFVILIIAAVAIKRVSSKAVQ